VVCPQQEQDLLLPPGLLPPSVAVAARVVSLVAVPAVVVVRGGRGRGRAPTLIGASSSPSSPFEAGEQVEVERGLVQPLREGDCRGSGSRGSGSGSGSGVAAAAAAAVSASAAPSAPAPASRPARAAAAAAAAVACQERRTGRVAAGDVDYPGPQGDERPAGPRAPGQGGGGSRARPRASRPRASSPSPPPPPLGFLQEGDDEGDRRQRGGGGGTGGGRTRVLFAPPSPLPVLLPRLPALAPASVGSAGSSVSVFLLFPVRGRGASEGEVEPVEPPWPPPLLPPGLLLLLLLLLQLSLLLLEPLLSQLLPQLVACALGIGQRASEEERALK